MKTLKFMPPSENMWHLNEKSDEKFDEKTNTISGKARITIFSLEDPQPGDVLNILGVDYTIQSITERRDHKGVFKNPEWNKNSFYDLQTTYTRIVKTKDS